MDSESRKRLIIRLCFLFLGIFIGISIDAEFRPNRIQFWINPVQDLSLRFVAGDTIEWYQLSTGEPMGITFWGGSPCVGTSNPCVIKSIPPTATYYYTCTASDGTTCNDPQGGPVTGTQRLEAPGFFSKISDLIENIFAPLIHIFSHSPKAGFAAAKATPAATYPTIHPQASCDASGVTHVIVNGHNVDDPIHASVGQQILWGTTAPPLTISLTNSATCSSFSSPAKDEYLCTVANAGGYTATASSCTANTSESIAVP
jgi:hypothetical protein